VRAEGGGGEAGEGNFLLFVYRYFLTTISVFFAPKLHIFLRISTFRFLENSCSFSIFFRETLVRAKSHSPLSRINQFSVRVACAQSINHQSSIKGPHT